jgi:hypothetical protein
MTVGAQKIRKAIIVTGALSAPPTGRRPKQLFWLLDIGIPTGTLKRMPAAFISPFLNNI